MQKQIIATRSMYLTASGEAVEEGDPRAQFLLVSKGSPADRGLLLRYMREAQVNEIAPVPVETRYYLGFDVGGTGEGKCDYSALVVVKREGPRPDAIMSVVHLVRFPLKARHADVANEVCSVFSQAPSSAMLFVDSTGVGSSVYQRVEDNPLVENRFAFSVTITPGSSESFDGRHINLSKRCLITSAMIPHESHRVKLHPQLPQRELLENELRHYRRKQRPLTMSIIWEAWRQRDHDDLAFALFLALWAAGHRRLDPEPLRLLDI